MKHSESFLSGFTVNPILSASTRATWEQRRQEDGSCDLASLQAASSESLGGRLIRGANPFLLPILVSAGSLEKPSASAMRYKFEC